MLRKLTSILFLLSILQCALPSIVMADSDNSYAAGGIFPPLQYPGADESVVGIRSSLGWAKHKKMYGADFSPIGNITTSKFVGMALSGIFNRTEGKATIIFLQAAGLVNYNKAQTDVLGMQWTLGYNHSVGVNNIYGLQLALAGNFGKNNIFGVQFGFVNKAESVYGFQIGLYNKVKNLHGLQIGLVNVCEHGGLPFFPVINVGF
jgi:hypothetical protein